MPSSRLLRSASNTKLLSFVPNVDRCPHTIHVTRKIDHPMPYSLEIYRVNRQQDAWTQERQSNVVSS